MEFILAREYSNGTEQASRGNYKRNRSKNLQFYLPNDHPHDYSRVLTTYTNNQTRIWTDITLNALEVIFNLIFPKKNKFPYLWINYFNFPQKEEMEFVNFAEKANVFVVKSGTEFSILSF